MMYKKLVRDKIPKIIESNGEMPLFEVLSDEEFYKELVKKLKEEVEEFVESDEIEELADVIEIIRKILEVRGKDMLYLEEARKLKEENRGGFDKKFYLKSVK